MRAVQDWAAKPAGGGCAIGGIDLPREGVSDQKSCVVLLTRYFRTLSLRELQVDPRMGGVEQSLGQPDSPAKLSNKLHQLVIGIGDRRATDGAAIEQVQPDRLIP